jgi:hypothetical protein
MKDPDVTKMFTDTHGKWQEEFHIYGIVTTIEDHHLPQADIDPETDVTFDVDPQDCEACQKEYYNRPKYPVKGWDYDDEPIPVGWLFGDS